MRLLGFGSFGFRGFWALGLGFRGFGFRVWALLLGFRILSQSLRNFRAGFS